MLENEDMAVAKATLFRSGRSIAALQLATDNQLIIAEDQDALHCETCVPEYLPSVHSNHSTKGVFHYKLHLGRSFGDKELMPTPFKSMRTSVKAHFAGAFHRKSAAKAENAKKLTAGRFAANTSIAHRVINTAYYVLKNSMARATFEDLVVLQHRNGLRVGDLNHSEGLIRTLRVEFALVMGTMVTRFVRKQPCVSLLADKVTVARRTVDITAIVTVVPEAPPQEMVQAFIIAAPVVREHSGDALAKELQQSLLGVGVDHPDQLAAICMDGAYHHQHVPQKLLGLMRAKDERFSTEPCVAVLWDGSHLLNLADKDAREGDGCEWVSDTIDDLTSITKRYNHGKGLETLLTAGEERGDKILRPKLWSCTRFAPHASRTFKTFINNKDTFVSLLEAEVKLGPRDEYTRRHLNILKSKKNHRD